MLKFKYNILNKSNSSTLIHEEGHAKAIIDIITKSNNPNYCPTMAPIILIGDYKAENAKPFEIGKSENCLAYIIYYPVNPKYDRGLTLHPCMDFMTDDEIKLCAKAGYDAEASNKPCFFSFIQWSQSSDYKYYNNPQEFKTIKPLNIYSSFNDAYWHFFSLYMHF